MVNYPGEWSNARHFNGYSMNPNTLDPFSFNIFLNHLPWMFMFTLIPESWRLLQLFQHLSSSSISLLLCIASLSTSCLIIPVSINTLYQEEKHSKDPLSPLTSCSYPPNQFFFTSSRCSCLHRFLSQFCEPVYYFHFHCNSFVT